MSTNKALLREYQATMRQLQRTVKTCRVKAASDGASEGLEHYVRLTADLVSRLDYLSGQLLAPPAGA